MEIDGGSGADVYYVTATATHTEQLAIRTGAGQDTIQIGSATTPLSTIHGLVDVRQTVAEDILRVYSGSTAGTTLAGQVTSTGGDRPRPGLAASCSTGWGSLGMYLGNANDESPGQFAAES